MAAAVSAWAKPGAWALDSEQHEAELDHETKDNSSSVNGDNHSATNGGDFPTLAAAASASTKTKKKKGQTLSLQEFNTSQSTSNKSGGRLTPDELLSLPTGPRQRSAEELEQSRGFRSFRDDQQQPRRQRDPSRDFAPPSRADEIDDWGAAKKTPAPSNGFERRESREGGRGFFSDSQSRADEVDNWAANKTFVPSDGRRNERRGGGGFDSNGGSSSYRAADFDNWVKRKEEEGRKFGSSGGGGAFDSLRERRGGGSFDSTNGLESDSWGRRREESSGSGRPRLNLQPRTLPLVEVNGTNGQQQQSSEILAKPKSSSPFGDARPREEVLKEKGQDWKEIEEKLESGKIKEAAEERPAFGKRGFGSGNWRGDNWQDDRREGSWRKAELGDASSPSVAPLCSSAEKTEDGTGEEAEDEEPQM